MLAHTQNGTPRWLWPTVVGLLVLHWTMAVSSTREESPALDEIAHFTAGYSYWVTGDFRLGPENGLLPQAWDALPLVFLKPRFPSFDQGDWRTSNEWRIGHQFFYSEGNDLPTMLLFGRSANALLSAALGLVVFCWSRRLFGTAGGLISLFFFTFSPTMLAHGRLITSDTAFALFLLLSVWCCWRLMYRVSPATLLASALSLAALFLSKMSAVLILPMWVLLLGTRLLTTEPLEVGLGEVQRMRGRGRQLAVNLAAIAVTLGLVFGLVWMAYGCRYTAFRAGVSAETRFHEPWDSMLHHQSAVRGAVDWVRDHRLLPEAYVYGFAHVIDHADYRTAFLNGHYSLHGFRFFFPYCFAVKTPLPLFLGLGLAIVAVLRRPLSDAGLMGWRGLNPLLPLVVLIGVYGASAILSHLNIGHRHFLPIYPALFVFCGACRFWLARERWWFAVTLCLTLVWFAAESLRIRPHYLAYFNAIDGGPRQGYRHLVDSSLDWGQDLPGLKRWLDRHAPTGQSQPPVYLSYFGTGDPSYYGVRAVLLPCFPDVWRNQEPYSLTGGIYCISATMLQAAYPPVMGPWSASLERNYQAVVHNMRLYEQSAHDPHAREGLLREAGAKFWVEQQSLFEQLRFGRLCAFLRRREPVDEVGYSILVYRLTDDEVAQALSGPPPELASVNPIWDGNAAK